MAKAKKESAADAGATKKQATGTKKAAGAKHAAAAPKATGAAASTTKAVATTTKSTASAAGSGVGGAATKKRAPAKPSPSGAPAPSSMPLIDTSLAAETAAKLVMNRALLGGSASQPAASQGDAADDESAPERRESSAFKQLKAGLNKPLVQGPGGILGGAGQNKKGNSPFGGGNQQVGRNQTFGADVNRSGVPRRTGG